MIYVAHPFSHKDETVQEERLNAVSDLCIRLIERGYRAFTPIAYVRGLRGEPGSLRARFNPPCGWYEWDLSFIENADAVVVYRLPGWRESEGVKKEAQHAEKQGKEVWFAGTSDEEFGLLVEWLETKIGQR